MQSFFYNKNNRLLLVLISSLLIFNIYNIISNTPMVPDQHWAQKIFYVHVPSAWVGFLSYLIVMIAGIMFFLKKNDYWIYGATDRANDDVNDIIFKSPIALIIGGESSGLRKKTLENCDFTLKINMNGVVESLNMAVATGILINTIYSKIK